MPTAPKPRLEATVQEQLLLKEYDNAAQLTYHIDGLRDRITVFFVTVAGIAGAGLAVVLKEPAPSSLSMNFVAALFLLLALLGGVIVMVLARLRAVQLEHFRILTNIRKHFYGSDLHLWNTIQLSPRTMPKPTHTSGTYMWLLAIILFAAFSAGAGAYLLVHEANDWMSNNCAWLLAVGGAVGFAVVLDRLYMWRAKAPAEQVYEKTDFP